MDKEMVPFLVQFADRPQVEPVVNSDSGKQGENPCEFYTKCGHPVPDD